MQLYFYTFLESIIIIGLGVFWCEYGYYHYVFKYNCSGWPELSSESENTTRILVLADTHIMGPIKSYRIDKMRREWQMKQAFRISTNYFKPDIVMNLGDIFDEASFSQNEAFRMFYQDYEETFPSRQGQKIIVIAGNHDVGFHNQMIKYPRLLFRFHETLDATNSIELLKHNNLNIVVINSMSFYNDTCGFCTQSIADTNMISRQLNGMNRTSPETYSRPILLTHIPLYRVDDTLCEYPYSLREVVKKNSIEGEDVLHKAASNFLLDRLKPRLILSGHTHMYCNTSHNLSDSESVSELTISSYNHKYAEKKPDFLLLSVNSTHTLVNRCYLIEEWVIVSIYIATVLIVCSRIIFLCRRYKKLI